MKWRFKTEEEFIIAYGENWRAYNDWKTDLGEDRGMNYLLGRSIPDYTRDSYYTIERYDVDKHTKYNSNRWYIQRSQLTQEPLPKEWKILGSVKPKKGGVTPTYALISSKQKLNLSLLIK